MLYLYDVVAFLGNAASVSDVRKKDDVIVLDIFPLLSFVCELI